MLHLAATALAAIAAAPAPTVAVLDVDDQLPLGGRLPVDQLVILRGSLEAELSKGGRFKLQPHARVAEATARRKEPCTEIACFVQLGRELGASKVVAASLRLENASCVLSAALIDVASARNETSASHDTSCDTGSLLQAVRTRIAAGLRGEQPKEAGAPKMPTSVTDKRLAGKWMIKRADTSQDTDTGDLSGAIVDLGADGSYKVGGKIVFDRGGEPADVSLSGKYGFDGKWLTLPGWGPEFKRCQVIAGAPSKRATTFSWGSFEPATCKMLIEKDVLWLWYPGEGGVITLDSWKREAKP